MVKSGPRPRGYAAGAPRPGGPGLVLAAALAAAVLGACSLDYGQAMLKELEAGLPDLVLYDFTHTVVEAGSPRFRLRAELGESYGRDRRMELFGVAFTEFDAEGEPVAEGRVDRATFFTDTESVVLDGELRFVRISDGLAFESSYLRWNQGRRYLSSRGDALTTIEDGAGGRVSGGGFRADAARRGFSFDGGAEGTISPAVDSADSVNEGSAGGGTAAGSPDQVAPTAGSPGQDAPDGVAPGAIAPGDVAP